MAASAPECSVSNSIGGSRVGGSGVFNLKPAKPGLDQPKKAAPTATTGHQHATLTMAC